MRVVAIGRILPGTASAPRKGSPARFSRRAAAPGARTDARVAVRASDLAASNLVRNVTVLGAGDGGGGDVTGGNGGGGGGGDDEGGSDDPHRPSRTLGLVSLALAASVVPACAAPRPARAGSEKDGSSSPSDLGVCFLYGFTWFYGVKLFLKNFFSPVLLFMGSMFILTKAGVLPESLGREAYEGYVKPRVPKEWREFKVSDEVVDDKVKEVEKRFWQFVKRVLPACDTPTAEKAFFAGIILAGLA